MEHIQCQDILLLICDKAGYGRWHFSLWDEVAIRSFSCCQSAHIPCRDLSIIVINQTAVAIHKLKSIKPRKLHIPCKNSLTMIGMSSPNFDKAVTRAVCKSDFPMKAVASVFTFPADCSSRLFDLILGIPLLSAKDTWSHITTHAPW